MKYAWSTAPRSISLTCFLPTCGETVFSSSLLAILRATPARMKYSLVPVPDMYSAHLWGDGIFLQPPGNPRGYSSPHEVLPGPCTWHVFCPPVGRRYLPPTSWQSSWLLPCAWSTPRSLYLTCFLPTCGETVSSSNLLAILLATPVRMKYSPVPVPDMFSAHLWGDSIFLQPPGNPPGYSSPHEVLPGPCTGNRSAIVVGKISVSHNWTVSHSA
jgi:hypothetical protein